MHTKLQYYFLKYEGIFEIEEGIFQICLAFAVYDLFLAFWGNKSRKKI